MPLQYISEYIYPSLNFLIVVQSLDITVLQNFLCIVTVVFYILTKYLAICISYNTGKSALPDVYA